MSPRMIEPESHEKLRREISELITADRALLDGLRADIRPLRAQVNRELVEWAMLYASVKKKDCGTDTLIVFDGLLRSKVSAGNSFKKYLEQMRAAIQRQYREKRRRIYLVGVAKHRKVLARYRL